jgi:hypothetical protein
MGQVTIDGKAYDIGRIDTFKQLDIARRWSPVLVNLGLIAHSGKGPPDPQAIYKAMMLFSRGIPQEDQDFVMASCLSVVTRQADNGQGWQPVREPQSGRLMFDDMDVMTVLQLTWRVLEAHRLPEFFYSPPSNTTAGAS